MKISKERLSHEAEKTGFREEILEKVIYLMNLLQLFNSEPILQNKLALKGGTALNLFIFDIPRLSVDIDLNYIGHQDRDSMLEDRKVVENSMSAITRREGYEIKRIPEEHAGGKWNLVYETAHGVTGNLQIDINYMFRVPLWTVNNLPPKYPTSPSIDTFPIMDLHELAAGKLAALFSRSSSRDLYDSHQLLTTQDISFEKLKLAFIVYGAMNPKDWRSISLESIPIPRRNFINELIPMLRKSQFNKITNPLEWAKDMYNITSHKLEPLIHYTENEKEFLDLVLDHGVINASLLTSDTALAERIENHPGLQWQALNARKKA